MVLIINTEGGRNCDYRLAKRNLQIILAITPLSAFFTSGLPAMWFLNSFDMSSIVAFAAKFLALSVRFLNIICGRHVQIDLRRTIIQ